MSNHNTETNMTRSPEFVATRGRGNMMSHHKQVMAGTYHWDRHTHNILKQTLLNEISDQKQPEITKESRTPLDSPVEGL